MSGQDFFARLLLHTVREIAHEIARPQRERREELAARARREQEQRQRRQEERACSREQERTPNSFSSFLEKVSVVRERREAEQVGEAAFEHRLEAASVDGSYSFDRLKEHYVTPAIALVRPYPPHRRPCGRSRFGGFPNLPAGSSWPRMGDGRPLHFMGQVDLAEVPAGHIRGLLPESGTLLFFVRYEERLSVDGTDAVRVLFDEQSSGAATAPPDDLPPVDRHWQRCFALPGETGPNTWPSWPWQLGAIQSVPDAGAYHHADRSVDFEDYIDRHLEFRAEQIHQATGLYGSENGRRHDLCLFDRHDDGSFRMRPAAETGFPWVARGVALVTRSVLRQCEGPELAGLEDELRQFLGDAGRQPGSDPVPAEAAEAFIGLLDRTMQADVRVKPGSEHVVRGDRIKKAIELAVHRLISESGGDAGIAAALPEVLYNRAHDPHAPIAGRRVQHAQMLGYTPSSQDPLNVSASTLTLLQLATDSGIDLIIGDMGQLDFFIEPDALARRDWNSVSIRHVGG